MCVVCGVERGKAGLKKTLAMALFLSLSCAESAV